MILLICDRSWKNAYHRFTVAKTSSACVTIRSLCVARSEEVKTTRAFGLNILGNFLFFQWWKCRELYDSYLNSSDKSSTPNLVTGIHALLYKKEIGKILVALFARYYSVNGPIPSALLERKELGSRSKFETKQRPISMYRDYHFQEKCILGPIRTDYPMSPTPLLFPVECSSIVLCVRKYSIASSFIRHFSRISSD